MREIPRFRPRVVDEQFRTYWRKMERTQGTPVPGIPKSRLKEQDLHPDWVMENLERCPLCNRPMVSPVPNRVYGKICWSCSVELKRYKLEG